MDGWFAPDGLLSVERVVITLLVGLGVGIAGSHLVVGNVVAAALAALAIRKRSLVTGCLALIPLGIVLGVPWPIPAIVAIAMGWLFVRPGQSSTSVAGSTGLRTVIVTLVLSGLCASTAVLVVEISIDTPVIVHIDEPSIPLLAAGILVVSAINSAGEELLWRGLLHGFLIGSADISTATTILTTTISFGVAHLAGVPGGPIGVVAAALLGAALGVVRTRLGFTPCVVVHFVVDVAIFSSLAASAVWVGWQSA